MEFAVSVNVEPKEVADLIKELEGPKETGVRRGPSAGEFLVHVSTMHQLLTRAATMARKPSTIESDEGIATALLREAGVLA